MFKFNEKSSVMAYTVCTLCILDVIVFTNTELVSSHIFTQRSDRCTPTSLPFSDSFGFWIHSREIGRRPRTGRLFPSLLYRRYAVNIKHNVQFYRFPLFCTILYMPLCPHFIVQMRNQIRYPHSFNLCSPLASPG